LNIGILFVFIILFTSCSENPIENRNQTTYGSGFEIRSCEQIIEKDIYELCLRIRDKDPEEFDSVLMTNRLHGHVGPNNIYGAKMGLYAKQLLNGKDAEIFVLSEAGPKTPIGCLNDGIMSSIHATFGRGLIENLPNSSKLAATFFYKNSTVRLEVKPEKLNYSQDQISKALKEYGGLTEEYFVATRKTALYVWEYFNQYDLFLVTMNLTKEDYCDYSTRNTYLYSQSLHNLIHTAKNESEIITFINSYPCINDGNFITQNDGTIRVLAIWKSNNNTIEYVH